MPTANDDSSLADGLPAGMLSRLHETGDVDAALAELRSVPGGRAAAWRGHLHGLIGQSYEASHWFRAAKEFFAQRATSYVAGDIHALEAELLHLQSRVTFDEFVSNEPGDFSGLEESLEVGERLERIPEVRRLIRLRRQLLATALLHANQPSLARPLVDDLADVSGIDVLDDSAVRARYIVGLAACELAAGDRPACMASLRTALDETVVGLSRLECARSFGILFGAYTFLGVKHESQLIVQISDRLFREPSPSLVFRTAGAAVLGRSKRARRLLPH